MRVFDRRRPGSGADRVCRSSSTRSPDIEVAGVGGRRTRGGDASHTPVCGPTSVSSTSACPRIDGIEATRQLAGVEVDDPLAVVIITTFDLDEYVHGALKAGARGFLLKDAGPDLLVQAVRAAANGDALIAPNITIRLLAAFSERAHTGVVRQPIQPLTDREERVLTEVARGRTNAEIAAALGIGVSTVKTHVAHLMDKLHVRNRVELAMWAHETGRMR